MFDPIDIHEKFGQVREYYTPKQITSVNGTAVKIAKFKGPFTWHAHADSNEIFWVVRGEVRVMLRTPQGETAVAVKENQLYSVPMGTEHMPVAENEAWVVLLEPEDMLNTGNVDNEFTVRTVEKI